MATHLFRSYCIRITFFLFFGFQLVACGTTDNPATGIACLSPDGNALDCSLDVPADTHPVADSTGETGDDTNGNDETPADSNPDPGSEPPPPPTSTSLTIRWTAPSTRTDGSGLSLSEIAGYRIYYGDRRGRYSSTILINDGSADQRTISNLNTGRTYYFVMTTIDSDGRESGYSAEYAVTI